MYLRKVADYAPMVSPIICAFLMMAVALSLSVAFADRDAGRCCGSSDVKLPNLTQGSLPRLNNLQPELYARRINYVAASEFQTVAIVAVFVFGAALILQSCTRGGRRWQIAFVLALTALGAATACIIITITTSPTLHRLLEATVIHEFRSIEAVRMAFERTTSTAATFLVATAALLLMPVSGSTEKRLRESARRHTVLSYLLALGTVLLTGDVLLKMCGGRWAIAYFPAAERPPVQELVNGIVSGWATYDSLFLAVTYIPAAVILRSRLQRYASEVDSAEAPPWFQKEWLAVSSLQEISKIIAILAPFLVGQGSDIVGLLK